jgi:hypothetical protein
MPQQGDHVITGPTTAPVGGTITVEVKAEGVTYVAVSTGGPEPSYYPIEDGKAVVDVPAGLQPGERFWVFVGTGRKMKHLLVEVSSSS